MQASQNVSDIHLTLKNTFGFSQFRDGQEEIIRDIINEKQILAIMPTGAGKSLCYQLPAIISEKRTIIISPLIALIDDQISTLKESGIYAEKLHSNQSSDDLNASWYNFKSGKCKILYVSPERLMSDFMIRNLKELEVGLFVIDEIHCVSKWGQSFRPEYEQLSKIKDLFPQSNIVGFTATADQTTRLDILNKIFNNKAKTFVKGFDRPNLFLSIIQKNNAKRQLLDFLNSRKEQSGIIYCLSRKRTEEISSFLNQSGFKTSAYHAGLDANVRKNVQDTFMTEENHIVIATIAFGMGIDKPDIRFVVHLNIPSSMEAYYQEIGRAGRDGNPADTLLIYGIDDVIVRRKMIEENNYNDEFKLKENKRLDHLVSYCETPECRRKVLLAYFDENSHPCNHCDNCNNPPTLIDGTLHARKMLATIYKTGQFFGQAHIINVLRGSEDKKILDRGHNLLSVHGIGKDQPREFWKFFFGQLLTFGHVTVNFQKYMTVQITKTGMEILKEKRNFKYKIFPKKQHSKRDYKIPNKTIQTDLSPDLELLKSLKTLRLEFAKKQNLPAFTVFHDTTLIQMSSKKPMNEEQFLSLDGVGPAKLKKYGESFLNLIKTFH